MDNIFDVYQGLHQFNDALYEATLFLEAIAKSGQLEKDRMDHCRASICQVRSATNLYLFGVIQEIERQHYEVSEQRRSGWSMSDSSSVELDSAAE
jgi:hypothetical protein